MQVKISPQKMGGKISAIPSKSYAHRILLCSMLADHATKIIGASSSKDIEATLNCIKSIGSKITISKNYYFITPKIDYKKSIELDCIESGSTLRFILPIACALGLDCNIVGKEGLSKRPLTDLLQVLRDHGADIQGETLPIHVSGKLKSGIYKIRGDVSSQYITGLLMALPLLEGNSSIIIEKEQVSSKYIDITLDVLSDYGIIIEKTDNGYDIVGNQKYVSPNEITIQGDWSNSAFWLALGALNNGIEVDGLSFESVQGDREIIQILSNMGANILMDKGTIIVKKSKLSGIELDAKMIPDLVPIVSVLMANAEGISIIKNVDRLKIKESDRLQAIIELLKLMNIKVRYKDNELMILGDHTKKFSASGYNDHRMVMTESIASSIADGECQIEGIEAVNKSYPLFFEDYKKLGGIIHVK